MAAIFGRISASHISVASIGEQKYLNGFEDFGNVAVLGLISTEDRESPSSDDKMFVVVVADPTGDVAIALAVEFVFLIGFFFILKPVGCCDVMGSLLRRRENVKTIITQSKTWNRFILDKPMHWLLLLLLVLPPAPTLDCFPMVIGPNILAPAPIIASSLITIAC